VDADQVAVVVRGDVGPKQVRYAQRKVAHVIEMIDEPLVFARVKLTEAGDPARELPAMAEAVLEIDGQMIRAHVAGHIMSEAIDLLADRVRRQLDVRKQRRLAVRKRGASSRDPGEWRRGDLPAHRPAFFPRPVEERQVVRHKAYELRPLTPAQAQEEMLRLDYDFHLFTDALTGEDSLLFRLPVGGSAVWTLSSPQPAPAMKEAQAAERLDLVGERFVLYRDTDSGRAAVMYRRYDGHYGVITAAGLVQVSHGPGSRALPVDR
jgi:ribosome-associated translation inhibitor RaiA